MKRILTVLALVISLASPLPAHGADWVASPTKNWVDCSSGFRNTDCIESVEFSDKSTEVRDANGALDYNSVKWIKTEFTPNKNYKYQSNWDGNTKSDDGCNSWGNSDYFADGCYKAVGLKSGGGDILFHMQVYTGPESMKAMQWVDSGEDNPAVREDGWKAITVPVGSTWKVTLKSDNLAKELGWIQSNVKNPRISIFKGSDGQSRVSVLGSVYPAFGGCNVPSGAKKPATQPDEIWCQQADTYAETMSQGFSIDYMPYKYQTQSMVGTAAGGIIVASNGSIAEVRVDSGKATITVPIWGPHFEFDKQTINKGWMETSIKGDVVRKGFKLDPATIGNFAKVEISDVGGTADIATYNMKYLKDIDTIEIRAYNFHYSKPTVKITLAKVGATTASNNGKKPSNVSSMQCIKGKVVKTITGVNPKCPAGWKKK